MRGDHVLQAAECQPGRGIVVALAGREADDKGEDDVPRTFHQQLVQRGIAGVEGEIAVDLDAASLRKARMRQNGVDAGCAEIWALGHGPSRSSGKG